MTHGKWRIVLMPLTLLAACDVPTGAPAPPLDPALRTAVDTATAAYDTCLRTKAKARLGEEPVATAVIVAERACKGERAALSRSIMKLQHAQSPDLTARELQVLAGAAIESIAPAIRQRAATALLTDAGAARTAATGQDEDASN